MSVKRMLAEARKDLGISGRPNEITRDYASRHGKEFLRAPWCNMAVTRWGRKSGNATAVLPKGDRAYTVWHAQDGKALGYWYAGTPANIAKHARPGAIVFFDWGGTDSIPKVDHVGVVELNLGDGRVQTIEGNTGDACKRRVRGASVIAGFWNPSYATEPARAGDELEEIVATLPLLKLGAKGWAVKRMFYLLISHGFKLDPKVLDDTTLSKPVETQLKAFQKSEGLEVDGECGPKTWRALILP